MNDISFLLMSHSTSSEQIAEPDPFSFGSNFVRVFIIDVKFDEESKSELRIGYPCKEKPENAENFRKIMKLLVEKNDVAKYLVYQ